MPHISTFVYCESLQNENTPNGPKLHIVSPIHIITPMFIPSMYSFCINFGVLDLQLSKTHIIKYIFRSPKEGQPNIIDTGDIILPIQQDTNNLPDDMNGIMMNFDFRNIPLQCEGEYVSEVFIDGECLGEFPIKVKGREN